MTLTSAIVDMGKMHEISLDLIKLLGSKQISMGEGAIASALTLARLHAAVLGEEDPDPDKEIERVQGIMMYMDSIFPQPAGEDVPPEERPN